jgi:hypothetical protein
MQCKDRQLPGRIQKITCYLQFTVHISPNGELTIIVNQPFAECYETSVINLAPIPQGESLMKKYLFLACGLAAAFVLSNVCIADGTVAEDSASASIAVDETVVQESAAFPPYPYAYQAPCGFAPFGYPPYQGYQPAPFGCRLKQRHVGRYYAPAFRPGYYPANLPPCDLSGLRVAQPAVAHVEPVQSVPAPYAVPVSAPYSYPYCGQPQVYYHPTPVRDFIARKCLQRPFIGYDPYAPAVYAPAPYAPQY